MKKLLALVLALMLVLGCASAMAAVFPAPPTVYVGYGAGGGTDTAVRPVVAAMAAYMGETINCVNMEGANSSVACDYVLGQPHDGTSMFATGTGGFSQAQVTTGGIPLSQADLDLMSERCRGLYLAGELLDVDGICGGYNLQWAFTSGWIAGKSAAEERSGDK